MPILTIDHDIMLSSAQADALCAAYHDVFQPEADWHSLQVDADDLVRQGASQAAIDAAQALADAAKALCQSKHDAHTALVAAAISGAGYGSYIIGGWQHFITTGVLRLLKAV
jgi:predicted lipoprotein